MCSTCREDAYLPDEHSEHSMRFASVMASSVAQMPTLLAVSGFLPLPCPESGLVDHAQPEAGLKVRQRSRFALRALDS